VTVDHLVAARVLEERDHHDRHLLTLLGQRGHKPALSLRPPKPQVRVPHVELVKLQIHRHAPPARSSPSSFRIARRGSLTRHAADQTGA
jgi:hypothetical protein